MKKSQNPYFKRVFLAFVIVTFIFTGCDQIRIAYYFADWYVVSRIDNYLDISGDQEDFLDDKADLLHEWHRREELPKIVTFLKSLKVRLNEGLTENDVPWFRSEFKSIQMRIVDKISDDFVIFLGTVTAKQIEYLEEQVSERNNAYYKKNFDIPEKQWRDKRIKRTIDNLEDFFGSITEEQNKLIMSSIRYDRSDYLKRFEQRKQVQIKISKILKSQEPPDKIKSVFLNWILDPDELQSDMYKKFSKQQTEKWTKFWLAVEDTITEKQRQTALEKIQDYIDTLESMAKG